MVENIFFLFSFILILLFTGCSESPTDSKPVDDTISKESTSRASLTINDVAFKFRRIPGASGKILWISETEMTEGQYHAVMDTDITVSSYPRAATWIQAIQCANKLAQKCDSLLSALRTEHAGDTTFVIDSNFSFNPLYSKKMDTSYAPSHLAIGQYVCFSDTDTLVMDSIPSIQEMFEDSFTVKTFVVCSVLYNKNLADPIKSQLVSKMLEAKPDSLHIMDSSCTIVPVDYNDSSLNENIITFADSALKGSDTATLTAFKHAYYFKDPRFIYNDTLSVNTIDTGKAETTFTIINVPVDSVYKRIFILVFSSTPSSTLLKNSLGSVFFGQYDSLLLPPDTTYDVSIWTKGNTDTAYGFRLPTEEEWEIIAQCGAGLTYSTYNNKLSSEGAVYGTTTPAKVASKKSNPFNMYDLTGNLFEWTDDWWTDNGAYTLDQDEMPKYVPFKVIKGGCYANAESDQALKTTGSYSAHPGSTMDDKIGFRVVIEDTTFWNYFIE